MKGVLLCEIFPIFNFYFSSSKRPERLISKLKAMNLEDDARLGKKMTVTRQPRGPDGSRGFKASRAYS